MAWPAEYPRRHETAPFPRAKGLTHRPFRQSLPSEAALALEIRRLYESKLDPRPR
jgi:hypothetical protein